MFVYRTLLSTFLDSPQRDAATSELKSAR